MAIPERVPSSSNESGEIIRGGDVFEARVPMLPQPLRPGRGSPELQLSFTAPLWKEPSKRMVNHMAVAQKSGTKMAPGKMEPKTKICVTVALQF